MNSILFSNSNHQLTISNVDLIGYSIVLLLSIIVTVVALKMSSFKSKLIEFGIIYVMVMIPILLLVLIKFVDKWIGIPIIQLSGLQSFILAGIILLVLIIIDFYLLRWIGVLTTILPISIMFIFEGLAKQSLYWNILQMFLAYGSLALLFLWYSKMEDKKSKN
ncbi:HAAS domain-containing protein [Bacillus rhizoplanae]|uniref:HAAS domain-containing protein n=1 Tax=Bacillus rhizoplanae TaxID=2880966 RepID=UPI003D1A8713